MLFKYKAVDEKGINKEGEIDAPNKDLAISGLQRRGLIVISIKDEAHAKSLFQMSFFDRVPMRYIVITSRQISTLFEAQVSALKAFSMLAVNADNKILASKLTQISDDLESGSSISGALSKHPDVFSSFYVNMVKAGEEVGKLNQTFLHLSEYLDRQYALTSKTRNALIYPIFVVITFFVVMVLMFVIVIPKLSAIILDSGQAVPVYTKIVIGFSNFFVSYGFILIIFAVLFGVWIWWLSTSAKGKIYIDRARLS
ncbi:type II secretion system F family protein, partial [Patescibacteria group bacterium]|nr:type II secretion system F family protein [Patescibacteria group bacterium]